MTGMIGVQHRTAGGGSAFLGVEKRADGYWYSPDFLAASMGADDWRGPFEDGTAIARHYDEAAAAKEQAQ